MKRILTLLFLCNLYGGFSQDSILVKKNLAEENTLEFQKYFFDALAQKSIFKYDAAIENLEKCNELKPNNIAVLFELSKNYLSLKRYFEAEEFATQALKIDAKNSWILKHLVKVYTDSKNLGKAIETQEKLVNINPREREPLVYLYFRNREFEKTEKLLSVLEKEQVLSPTLAKFKKQVFDNRHTKKKVVSTENSPELIKKFEETKSFETLRKLLVLFVNDKEQLLIYSNKGLELFPAQAFVYLMNAKALNLNKKYNKAIEQLTNGIDFVIENKSLEADFYDEFAISYKGLGNEKEAIKNKNKALALRNKL